MITLKHILVATDFGEASDAALEYGRAFARLSGGTLHVIHVVDDLGSHVVPPAVSSLNIGQLQAEMENDAHRMMDALITADDLRDLHAQATIVTSRATAPTILSHAQQADIDLVITGTHGRTGLAHFFLGSVAQQVVRTAQCPVLTVRAHERDFVRPDALQTQRAAIH